MELRDYWQTIRRRWKTIIACLLLALAVAGAVTWQTTPQYASTAQLFVSTSSSDSQSDAYTGGLFASQRVTSYADLVDTRELAERAADSLGGGTTPEDLTGKVTATVVPETVILELTATDPDPLRARDIAQAYAEGLSDLVEDVEAVEGRAEGFISASIVDDAQVAETPVSPQPLRNLGLAAVLGLLVGVGLAVARELLDTSVSSPEDVAAITEAPILGSIQADQDAAVAVPAEVLDDITPWAETFRVLRTNMQYIQVDSETKTVVVSSALPGEGKSTVAASLAVTLALAGQRVCLVDCDLRRPQVATRLGLDDAVGTTRVLVGQVDLADAVQPYGSTGLQVLTSGPIPPNPSELLQSHAMAEMLKDLQSRFEVVILDAPPLLPVTDAALLAAQADGAVVVVRHGKTTRDQLDHALERLEAVEATPLGVVLNLTPFRRSGKTYGYGYGYGYGYAPQDDAAKPSKRQQKKERKSVAAEAARSRPTGGGRRADRS